MDDIDAKRQKFDVVTTIEVDLDIHPNRLTPQFMEEFSAYMWTVGERRELFNYAARMCAQHGEIFIEGIGHAKRRTREDEKPTDEHPVLFKVLSEDTEVEARDAGH